MTVSSATARDDYTVIEILAVYDYTFRIFDEDDLEVVVRDSDGVETTLTKTTHYTVSGVGDPDGGSITLTSAAPRSQGDALTIRRVLPITQEADIRNQGRYQPASHEDQYDRLVMIDQQQQDQLDRSLRLPRSVSPDDVSAELPAPVGSKGLAWNSTGTAIVNVTVNGGGVTVDESAALAGSKGTPSDTNRFLTEEDRRLMPVIYAESVLNLDGTQSNDSAIEDLIGEAKLLGASTGTGARIVFPQGLIQVDNPIVLPRTGSTPTNVVHIEGASPRSCVLVGSSGFPEDRALIEWEASTSRSWHQRISNLRFNLPNVSGVMAIHYKLNGGTPTTVTEVLAERLNIQLEDLVVEGSNQYHTSLIRLEGSVAYSTIRRLIGDPSLGTFAADCILLHVDDYDFGSTPPSGQDCGGINYGLVEQLTASFRRGGLCALFKGRLNQATLRTTICNGTVDEPCISVSRGFGAILENLTHEGRGEKGQIKLKDCIGMTVRHFGLGEPNEPTGGIGNGVGDGLILENVKDSLFDTRACYSGTPSFNSHSVHAITLDEDCERNEFRNIGLSDSLADEVSDSGTDNFGTFVDESTGTREFLGTRPLGDATAGDVEVSGEFAHSGSKAGFFDVTPASRPAALTQTYSTADRTLGAYTPDDESTEYTGQDSAQAGSVYAKVADLNALRTAVENLRAFVEDLAQHHNAVVDDLQTLGLEQ